MEVSITDHSEVEKEILVNISADELLPHFEEAYKRHLPKIEIKGFRKGKAPLGMIKKIYGESIEYDSLSTIANDVFKKIIIEKDIHPIGEPVLTDMDFKRGEKFSFKVKYELKPVIDLKDYKSIAVDKTIHKVTDKEIEDEILRLRKNNSTMSDADTATDDEHVIIADMQELDESGSPLIGKKTSDMRLYLASDTMFQEIKDGLRGSSIGNTKRITIDSKQKEQKKMNHLEFTIKKIEKVIIPEFDDALVSKVTKDKVKTVAEFRKQLTEDITEFWKERSHSKLIDDIIGEIVRKHEFPVPESLVKGITDSLIEDLKNRYQNKKLPADFNETEFREKNHGYAIFQAKWFLIRERILDVEKIKVDDQDVEKLAEDNAPKMGIEKDKLLSFYKSSDSIRDRILTDKLTKFLIEHSKITEKITEEEIN
jgi:trigger factor